MESETEYWRRNRGTFLSKEGFPHPVTLSSILREEGTPHEAVVEELMGVSLAYGWRPVYIRLEWFVRPIEGSRVQVNVLEMRTISAAEYEAFLEYGTAALPQIWRVVCSCGVSSESRWEDDHCLRIHLALARPWAEHIVRTKLSPAGYWTWTERTQI